MSEDAWPWIASIIYTVVWSISFYGQIYENWKNKSVQGFSMDYLILNTSGYLMYALYSSIGYFTSVQGAGTVVLMDLLFVYHAMFCVIVMNIQSYVYPRGKNKPSYLMIGYTILVWVIVLGQILLTQFWPVIGKSQFWNPVSCLGYGKLALALIKCIPAIYWNCKRKDTTGWSIHMIILDFIGGIFSMASGELSTENGINVTKLALAIFSIAIDSIFIIQHFVLFRKKPKKSSPLLETGSQMQI